MALRARNNAGTRGAASLPLRSRAAFSLVPKLKVWEPLSVAGLRVRIYIPQGPGGLQILARGVSHRLRNMQKDSPGGAAEWAAILSPSRTGTSVALSGGLRHCYFCQPAGLRFGALRWRCSQILNGGHRPQLLINGASQRCGTYENSHSRARKSPARVNSEFTSRPRSL
jgi:hypothetical protein